MHQVIFPSPPSPPALLLPLLCNTKFVYFLFHLNSFSNCLLFPLFHFHCTPFSPCIVVFFLLVSLSTSATSPSLLVPFPLFKIASFSPQLLFDLSYLLSHFLLFPLFHFNFHFTPCLPVSFTPCLLYSLFHCLLVYWTSSTRLL